MACIVGARGIVGSWLRRIASPSCSVGFPWGNEEGNEQFELKRRRFIRNGYFQIAPLTSDI